MAVSLALLSGFFHALWNALAKSTGRPRGATLAVLSYALVFAALVLWLVESPRAPRAAWPWLLLAGLGESAYVYTLGKAYHLGDLALTYSLSRALALVFIWPLSYAAMGTVPTWLGIVATLCVTIAMLLARRPTREGGRPKFSAGYTAATGLSVAVYHTGYKGAVQAQATPVACFVIAIAIALVVLWVVQGGFVRQEAWLLLQKSSIVLAGALCAASFILMIFALVSADSGRILGVRNSSVGFATLFALVLGERLAAREWGALALLAVGISMFAYEQARH